MLDRFRTQLENLVGSTGKHRYLLAVSGGADSCVMAHLFHDAGLDFAIAHCNFHLRGEDSNQDMQLVQELAETLNATLFIQEFDTWALQKESGLSVEMIARKLRYDWFAEFEDRFDFIVTAHQANDVAETLLLNICRGTGLRGLSSIPVRNGNIIRPLLDFTAEEIRLYAHENHIPFAIDCTNSDETIKRNRIRASVVPVLQELNPNLIHTITRNCKIIQSQYIFYQNQLKIIKKELLSEKEGNIVINRLLLDKKEDKKVILYELLKEYGFTADVSQALCLDTEKQTGKHYDSATHTLLVNRDNYLIQATKEPLDEEIHIESMEQLNELFSVEKCQRQGKINYPKDNRTLFIPEHKLTFPLTLRHWHQGDYFYPLGCQGKQKISDFFTDHKINNFKKGSILLLCSGNDILWILGYRSDNRYKIEKDTLFYYKITYNGTF